MTANCPGCGLPGTPRCITGGDRSMLVHTCINLQCRVHEFASIREWWLP